MKWPMFLVLSLLVCAPRSDAEPSAEELKKFAAAVEQAFAANPPPKVTFQGRAFDGVRSLLDQLRAGIASGDLAVIESGLQQLPGYLEDEALTKQAAGLLADVRATREAKEAALAAEIQGAIRGAGKAVREAKSAAELDAVRERLAALREAHGPRGSAASPAVAALEPAIQFVTSWQDYLAARASGRTEEARNALSNLSSQDRSAILQMMPRSEILARMGDLRETPAEPMAQDNAEATRIIDGIRTLADFGPAFEALAALKLAQPEGHYHGALQDAMYVYGPLDRAYREFQAGLPTQLPLVERENFDAPRKGIYQNRNVPIFAELLTLMLPRFLLLPPETKANPGESPDAFLARLETEARAAEDFERAARIRRTRRLLQGENSPPTESAAGLYQTACNQEAAGQFALAVNFYERVLASGTDLVPARLVGERLRAIEKEHPDAFKEGMTQFLSPPRFGGFPGPPPGARMPPAGPGASPTPFLSLPIPARSAAPRPTAPTPSPTPMPSPAPTR